MDDIDLAKSLRGSLGGGTTTRRVSSPTTTTTISGTATGDSADGVVSVRIDGQGTGTGDDGSTEIATTANVREGDRVMVNLVGADGTGKSPVVTGVVGGADRQQGEIDGAVRTAMSAAQTADAAHDAAAEAKTIAEATGQHVWDDESGLHVTETEREDYEQTPTGFARLMTSAGELLTRAVEGVEKLLRSDTASGTVYYDGECAPGAQDAEDHVVTAFTKDGAQIGRKGNAHVEMDFNSFKMVDKDGVDFFSADDLRDETGVATITETFWGGGGTKRTFTVQLTPTEFVSATDSSHEGAAYTTSGQKVTFAVAPSDGATVTIVYKTASGSAKAYTLGVRKAGSVVGPLSVAEGATTTASGPISHAEGYYTTASGDYSHAEGHNTLASGDCSHAEGYSTFADNYYSHAEGYGAAARRGSHAEGLSTSASGIYSHAEGERTKASGDESHAEGNTTIASGDCSHAEGNGTRAVSGCQHVEGRYNAIDANAAHIIGNGTSDSNRSNAYTVDWHGNVDAAGTITGASVGDANGTLQQLRDSVSLADAGYVFTPYSGFTTLSIASQRFGPLVKLLVEVGTSTPRAAGQVNVGKWNITTSVHGLGAARIGTATVGTAYEGVCQLAGSGEMRFYSSTANATKFWGVVWMLLA